MNVEHAIGHMPETSKPLAIAVMAMGGQGGGVLVDWIVALCEAQGWAAQSTSIPGVAQRTGATIYYIETLPLPPLAPPGLRPVLSLMAVPGEVDIVIGAELMETGRAIQRGLVTPDRTVLITSSHRAYAVTEKQAPGNNIGDAEAVYSAARAAARQFVAFDMAALTTQSGSVISAVLFGALAATGALPFPREAYERTIRAAGIGVEPSLNAFALGFEKADTILASGTAPIPQNAAPKKQFPTLAPVGNANWDALIGRARVEFPAVAHKIIAAGLQYVVDFQDVAYGHEYLDVVAELLALDMAHGGDAKAFTLTCTGAKYIATAMAYDDVYRISDLKTRASRFARVRDELQVRRGQIVHLTEFMHPRMEEVCGSLPAALGHFIESRPVLFRRLDHLVNRGRRVKSSRLGGFLLLYIIADLRRFRRGTLRHHIEMTHRAAWLAQVRDAAAINYDLAVELLACRRLVKGYSDTHSHGLSKFDRVLDAAKRLERRDDAADWVRRLREAALKDEDGIAFSGALRTVDSFL